MTYRTGGVRCAKLLHLVPAFRHVATLISHRFYLCKCQLTSRILCGAAEHSMVKVLGMDRAFKLMSLAYTTCPSLVSYLRLLCPRTCIRLLDTYHSLQIQKAISESYAEYMAGRAYVYNVAPAPRPRGTYCAYCTYVLYARCIAIHVGPHVMLR
jgi:hypothetical protein